MIEELAKRTRETPNKPFFYTQFNRDTMPLSYAQIRYCAAAVGHALAAKGYTRGTYFAMDMYNCPELVVFCLACAYSGATAVLLNPRLTEHEQRVRLRELEAATNQADIPVIDEIHAGRAIVEAAGISLEQLVQRPGEVPPTARKNEIMEFARSEEEAFTPERSGVVMFTSGTEGTPKAAQLTWAELMGAARQAVKVLMGSPYDVWQLVLPLCHVGGFEVMVRSLINGTPFILYRIYDPSWILNDVLTFNVSHISVVDKMLRDLLEADKDKIISNYRVILLGGQQLNPKTLKAANKARAKVYASYGMTETSSMIACARVTRGFKGALKLLPEYEVNIMRPNEDGIGSLHIKGPGVFKGYLNSRAPFTADEYFVSGDRARMFKDGTMVICSRQHDVIISGGENIYPAEVREELLRVPGIRDAYVFGTPDETWGYRPVAFIEADYSQAAIDLDHRDNWLYEDQTNIHGASCPQEYVRMVHEYLDNVMSSLHHPKHLLVLKEFPRTVADKVDTQALQRLYDTRIDIKSVSLYRVKQPLVKPIYTAKSELTERESIFVEVRDWAGRTGVGECVSFSTDWYLPETIQQDWEAFENHLVEIVMNERYLHPHEVAISLATFPALAEVPQAKSAIECALWDLYGKIVSRPLHDLIGGVPVNRVPGGVLIGIMPVEETLQEVHEAVAAGYTRIKLKIRPEDALEQVRAIRDEYPNITLILDANQSFNESQLDELYKLDTLGIECFEEPLDPSYVPRSGQTSLFERLSTLQERLRTPICLDESLVSAEDVREAISYDNLRCYSVKISKFGGIGPSLDFIKWATSHGKTVWMGGMFDTGVNKRTYAAFETLADIIIPGDISDYDEYYEHDCALPPLVLKDGMLELNTDAGEVGIGCALDKAYLDTVLVDAVTFAK